MWEKELRLLDKKELRKMFGTKKDKFNEGIMVMSNEEIRGLR